MGRGNKIPAIRPLFVYGVKPDVHGGIFFAADNVNLWYVAGCGIAVYSTKVLIKLSSLLFHKIKPQPQLIVIIILHVASVRSFITFHIQANRKTSLLAEWIIIS